MAKEQRPVLTDCPSCVNGVKTVQKLDVARDDKGRAMAGRTVSVEIECPDCGGSGQVLGPPA